MNLGAAVYGGGGHAHVVASILRARGQAILGFFDDAYVAGQEIQGAPVLGRLKQILQYRDRISAAYLALGDNLLRSHAFKRLRREGFELPPLVHPSAWVEPGVSVGDGTVICMGAMVATQASLGRACLLNTGCCVDHESSLGDIVHLAPRSVVAGRSHVGELTFVGMGAVVAQGLSIGRRVAIGANSVVLADVPDGAKVLGVHAGARDGSEAAGG